jgi:hypothetical protein
MIASELELVLLHKFRLLSYTYVAMVAYAILSLHSNGYDVIKLLIHSSTFLGFFF